MIYHDAVQSVTSPGAVLPDVALLRRKWGEERCSSQEECGSTHAESVSRRVDLAAALVARVESSILSSRSAFHGVWLCLMVLCAAQSIPGMQC